MQVSCYDCISQKKPKESIQSSNLYMRLFSNIAMMGTINNTYERSNILKRGTYPEMIYMPRKIWQHPFTLYTSTHTCMVIWMVKWSVCGDQIIRICLQKYKIVLHRRNKTKWNKHRTKQCINCTFLVNKLQHKQQLLINRYLLTEDWKKAWKKLMEEHIQTTIK